MSLNKSFIIKKLNELLRIETNDTRITAYLRAIKNIKNYDSKTLKLDDFDNIKGVGPFLKKKISDFYNHKKDDYKSLIIEKLSILRDLELRNNETKKAKAYNNVILKLADYDKPINDINDIDNIKDSKIGITIRRMIKELIETGDISYIKKLNLNKNKKIYELIEKISVIVEDYNKSISIIKKYNDSNIYDLINNPEIRSDIKELIKKIPKSSLKTYQRNFNKENIIKNLEIIKDYEHYNNEKYKVINSS